MPPLRGNSVLDARLLLAPQGLGMLLTRTRAGKLTDRIGGRLVVLAGFAVMVLGTIAYTRPVPTPTTCYCRSAWSSAAPGSEQ